MNEKIKDEFKAILKECIDYVESHTYEELVDLTSTRPTEDQHEDEVFLCYLIVSIIHKRTPLSRENSPGYLLKNFRKDFFEYLKPFSLNNGGDFAINAYWWSIEIDKTNFYETKFKTLKDAYEALG